MTKNGILDAWIDCLSCLCRCRSWTRSERPKKTELEKSDFRLAASGAALLDRSVQSEGQPDACRKGSGFLSQELYPYSLLCGYA